MGDAFTPPPVGSRQIPSSFLKAVGDASRQSHNRQLAEGGAGALSAFSGAVYVRVRNDSGANVDELSVLGVSGSVFDPGADITTFKNGIVLTATTPADAQYRKPVITRDPIANGAIGWAVIGGISVCKVNVLKETNIWADIKSSTTTKLESCGGAGSARILYKESGTGDKWAIVQLGFNPFAHFPVLVTQNGGSAGTNKSAACTFTYDIYDAIADAGKSDKLNPSVLSLNGKGNGWRGLKIALGAAQNGRAYRTPAGTYILDDIDEYPAGEQDCS